MTLDKEAAILELLASKICHDLISPIGAVNNGIEFLEEMGADAGPDVTDLISFSAAQASAKLKAYRIAYGVGGADTNLKPQDVFKTMETMLSGDGKITQAWDPHKDLKMDEYPKGYCKILICLFMLAVECLPKGGKISAMVAADGSTRVRAENEHIQLKEPLQDALSHKTALKNLETRYVHAYITGVMAAYHGYKISITAKTETMAEFSFEKTSA
ncbi:MAG: histidine phosphotransferase family protein [Alphaproteobacteria bacterium]